MAAAENAEDLTGVAIGSVSMSSGYCFLQSVFTESSMQIFRSKGFIVSAERHLPIARADKLASTAALPQFHNLSVQSQTRPSIPCIVKASCSF